MEVAEDMGCMAENDEGVMLSDVMNDFQFWSENDEGTMMLLEAAFGEKAAQELSMHMRYFERKAESDDTIMRFEVNGRPRSNNFWTPTDEPPTIFMANEMETSTTLKILSMNGQTLANVRTGKTDTIGKIKHSVSQEFALPLDELTIVVGTRIALDEDIPSMPMIMVRNGKTIVTSDDFLRCALELTSTDPQNSSFFFPDWYSFEHEGVPFPREESDLRAWLARRGDIEPQPLTTHALVDFFSTWCWDSSREAEFVERVDQLVAFYYKHLVEPCIFQIYNEPNRLRKADGSKYIHDVLYIVGYSSSESNPFFVQSIHAKSYDDAMSSCGYDFYDDQW